MSARTKVKTGALASPFSCCSTNCALTGIPLVAAAGPARILAADVERAAALELVHALEADGCLFLREQRRLTAFLVCDGNGTGRRYEASSAVPSQDRRVDRRLAHQQAPYPSSRPRPG